MKSLNDFKVHIFLDSGNPADTRECLKLYPALAGQTTNPTLISRHPDIQSIINKGGSLSEKKLLERYQHIAEELSELIPQGSISLEVPARADSTSQTLLEYAIEMNSWIPNAHIKFPTNKTGLSAAQEFRNQNGRVNMTLGFTLSQAQAVHIATTPAKKGDVFYSSFVGRQYDHGRDGIQILRAVKALYKSWKSPVEILAASFRSLEQIQASVLAGVDIVTVPINFMREWAEQDFAVPETSSLINNTPAPSIPKEPIEWRNLLIEDDLTTEGLIKFQNDWEHLLKQVV
jgi:transaldolase